MFVVEYNDDFYLVTLSGKLLALSSYKDDMVKVEWKGKSDGTWKNSPKNMFPNYPIYSFNKNTLWKPIIGNQCKNIINIIKRKIGIKGDYMTVKELIVKLNRLDPKRHIIIQKNNEGNECSPMVDLWEGAFIPNSQESFKGTSHIEELTEEFKKAGYTEEDVCTDGFKAVFLVPGE